MKSVMIASTFAILGAMCSTSAQAQTCASPASWQPPAPSGNQLQVDTCSGDDSGSALLCGGSYDRVGPVYVIRSIFATPRTFTTITLSGGAAGFDPVMFMTPTAGGCGANQETCFPSGDTGFPISTTDVPDGDWLILVTAFGQNLPGSCGSIALASNGSVPVTLTRFTVD